MVDFMGLPHDVWVLREMLPVKPVAVLGACGGMPLVPEVRCFVRDGMVECAHGYWPEKAVLEGLRCDGHGDEDDEPDPHPPHAIEAFIDWHRHGPRECEKCKAEARRLYAECCAAVEDGKREWWGLAERAAQAFAGDGGWSVDLLPTAKGFFVTDMAVAERSFHWPGCPKDRARTSRAA